MLDSESHLNPFLERDSFTYGHCTYSMPSRCYLNPRAFNPRHSGHFVAIYLFYFLQIPQKYYYHFGLTFCFDIIYILYYASTSGNFEKVSGCIPAHFRNRVTESIQMVPRVIDVPIFHFSVPEFNLAHLILWALAQAAFMGQNDAAVMSVDDDAVDAAAAAM